MRIRVGIVLLALHSTAAFIGAQTEEDPVVFQGRLASAVMADSPRESAVKIEITRWTTNEERDLLVEALQAGDQDKLVRLLRGQNQTGTIRIGNGDAHRLRYARKISINDRQRILLGIDGSVPLSRFITLGETAEPTVTLVELRTNQAGRGEGWIASGLKLRFNHELELIEIEKYAYEPVRFYLTGQTED